MSRIARNIAAGATTVNGACWTPPGPRFAGGAFVGFIGSCIDVTDQRAATRALSESEEQLRLATEAAEVGLWDLDVGSGTLYWPARVKAMFGISADVPISMADYYGGLHPDDREATIAAYAAARDPAQRARYDVEYRTVGKEDGTVRWVASKGRALFRGDRCVRVIGAAIDITARKAAEKSFAASTRAWNSASPRPWPSGRCWWKSSNRRMRSFRSSIATSASWPSTARPLMGSSGCLASAQGGRQPAGSARRPAGTPG